MPIGSDKIEIEKRPDMIVNKAFVPMLAETGFLEFDRFFLYTGGKTVKSIKDRSVTRMEIPHQGDIRVFFLKRHRCAFPGLLPWIVGSISGKGSSPGMAEFDNIREFREKGLPTVVPVAAGVRKCGRLCFESFLVTENTAPYLALEKLIIDHPGRLTGTDGQIRKHRIIIAVARLARAMHEKGYNHRDFNATHVLVGPENDTGGFSLGLFDLQRMDRKKWVRFKWAVKTLAELTYSLPAPLFTEQDHLLMFKTYRNIDRFTLMDRLLLFWIARKARRIERHTRKIMIRKHNGRKSRQNDE